MKSKCLKSIKNISTMWFFFNGNAVLVDSVHPPSHHFHSDGQKFLEKLFGKYCVHALFSIEASIPLTHGTIVHKFVNGSFS